MIKKKSSMSEHKNDTLSSYFGVRMHGKKWSHWRAERNCGMWYWMVHGVNWFDRLLAGISPSSLSFSVAIVRSHVSSRDQKMQLQCHPFGSMKLTDNHNTGWFITNDNFWIMVDSVIEDGGHQIFRLTNWVGVCQVMCISDGTGRQP